MSERGGREVFSPLESAGGKTTIAEAVVSQIASIAVGEVEDVHPGGSAARRAGGMVGRTKNSLGKGSSEKSSLEKSRGVSVEVGQTEVAVDLKMGLEYGADFPGKIRQVREKVVNRIENLVGLAVTEVNTTITNVILPDQEEQGRSGGAREEEPGSRPTSTGSAGEKDEAEPDGVPDGPPGTRERGVTRVEPSSRTHTESKSGPVPEEEVRVEDVPVRKDETAELDVVEGEVKKRKSGRGDERQDKGANS